MSLISDEISEFTIWENTQSTAIRIGVGGDFFPTMSLANEPRELWENKGKILKPHFDDLDLCIVNLECPLDCAGLEKQSKLGVGQNVYGNSSSLQYLKSLGISHVGLANNHIFDFGSEGIAQTQKALRENKIKYLGASLEPDSTKDFIIEDLCGLKIGIWVSFLNVEKGEEATYVSGATLDRATSVAKHFQQEGCVCQIALIHAGLEKTNYPDPVEVSQMTLISELGFDLICACHSHRISGSLVRKRRDDVVSSCLYGLGSITSGCIYGELEREGMLAVLGLDETGRACSLSVRPIYLDGPGWGMIPEEHKRAEILNRFQEVSERIEDGSYSNYFYRDIGAGLEKKAFRDLTVAFRSRGIQGVFHKLKRIRAKHLLRFVKKHMVR